MARRVSGVLLRVDAGAGLTGLERSEFAGLLVIVCGLSFLFTLLLLERFA